MKLNQLKSLELSLAARGVRLMLCGNRHSRDTWTQVREGNRNQERKEILYAADPTAVWGCFVPCSFFCFIEFNFKHLS